jgi:pSer/pThr/pTyr-binding forkhead associated (FHA) protein
MRDGFTRKLDAPERHESFEDFAAKCRASVVALSGEAAGTEWPVQKPVVSIGRGDSCDWKIDDDTLSKEHAALEFTSGGFRLRDLGSKNGIRVNGSDVKVAELESGDRFQLGSHEFQLVLEACEKQPRTWILPDDE